MERHPQDIDHARQLPSIGSGLARAVLLCCICAASVANALFVLTAKSMLERETHLAITEQAKICAASLEPYTGRYFWPAVGALRARYDRLAAVATLDSKGALEEVYPNEPFYRAAAQATLDASGSRFDAHETGESNTRTLWGVVVALNGSESPTARRAVFLFDYTSVTESLWSALKSFAVMLVAWLILTVWLFLYWFHRRVTRPLRNLNRAAPRKLASLDAAELFPTTAWRETEQVAEQLRTLTRKYFIEEAEKNRLERELRDKLHIHRQTFSRQLRRAEDRARTDPLTGLRNRTFLEAELEPLVEGHRCREVDFAAVMMDVDNFKDYNDTHGHTAGDEILRFIGELLRAAVRPDDFAVRYGGDEFLLLLVNANDADAAHVADRVIKHFAQNVSRLQGGDKLSMSAGIASIKAGLCETGEALIIQADAALYASKRNGKGVVAHAPTP